jgi:hypothetical protein
MKDMQELIDAFIYRMNTALKVMHNPRALQDEEIKAIEEPVKLVSYRDLLERQFIYH